MARPMTAVASRPFAWRAWLLATRPRTLAAGLVPVAVGTALPGPGIAVRWDAAAGCLLGALLIQIGVNFANDAFDALKGADTPARLGPQRAVASGLITPRAMLVGTAIVLLAALGIGLWLTTIGGWPILVLGLVSLICAIAYTGGPYPLAYHGLGDLFVLLFFGLFAVLGSAWVQVADLVARFFTPGAMVTFREGMSYPNTWLLHLPGEWWLIAGAIGLQATAIIAVNNLRDIATDAPVGKRTLAVRLGEHRTRWYYALLHLAAAGCWWAATALLAQGWLAVPATIATVGGAALAVGVARTHGAGLNRYLARSASLELITGLSAVVALRI